METSMLLRLAAEGGNRFVLKTLVLLTVETVQISRETMAYKVSIVYVYDF